MGAKDAGHNLCAWVGLEDGLEHRLWKLLFRRAETTMNG
jgi:hypothetical protein